MTSMPASRSARATTLAPRSCPSNPGLATTTRMRPCATVTSAPFAVAPARPRCQVAPGKILPGRWPATTLDPGGPRAVPAPDPAGQPRRTAYLPPRAAKARKLILRSQLGRGWIVASVAFGLVILVAGGLYLARAGRPGPPWVRVAALQALPAGAVTEVPGASRSARQA